MALTKQFAEAQAGSDVTPQALARTQAESQGESVTLYALEQLRAQRQKPLIERHLIPDGARRATPKRSGKERKGSALWKIGSVKRAPMRWRHFPAPAGPGASRRRLIARADKASGNRRTT